MEWRVFGFEGSEKRELDGGEEERREDCVTMDDGLWVRPSLRFPLV